MQGVSRRLIKKKRYGVIVAKEIYGEGQLTQTITARGVCWIQVGKTKFYLGDRGS